MALTRCAKPFGFLFALSIAIGLAQEAQAVPTVWSGPTVIFTKTGANTADTTNPLNQDRLTGNVWLTRGSSQGIFNVAPGKESAYVSFTSPADTQWATSVMSANFGKTIAASNWPQLSFTSWAPAYGGPGSVLASNITTHNAVMHLITDDIYLDLTFTQFTSGGNFAYQRSTASVPEPSAAVGAIVASGLFCCGRRRKSSASV
jgi:hypothetical protein